MKLSKKVLIKSGIVLISLLVGVIVTMAVYFNVSSSGGDVAVITTQRTAPHVINHPQDVYHNKDETLSQRFTLKVLSGSHRGRSYTITNTYLKSQLMTQEYRIGQRVFIAFTKGRPHLLGPKRDWVLVLALVLTLTLMIAVSGRKSILLMASLALNGILFAGVVKLDIVENGTAIFPIYGTAALLFSLISLMIVQGFSLKMWVTWSATVVGVAVSFALCYAVMRLTHETGIKYEAVDYATQDPRSLFLAQMILGVLGAVMDEATDILSSLYALIQTKPTLTKKALWESGRRLGQEIMGPLINVLVLIFMAEALPMTILFLRDNNTLSYTFQFALSLGLVQSVVSAIGIVLLVPISTGFSFVFLREKKRQGGQK